MEYSSDLPDSTDWITTSLPAFSPLEAALRCEVCKEFYNNPVITSCSHTFCSLCIRRCISVDGKCPACKSACQSDKLVTNIAVREVVSRWVDARKGALELAQRDKEGTEPDASRKKRTSSEAGFEEEGLVRQTRQRSTRSGRRAGASQRVDDEHVIILESEEETDEEYLSNGFSKCPICNTGMKAELIFDHVGICDGEYTGGRSTRSRKNNALPKAIQQIRSKEHTPPTTRLSGLNYAMLTDTAFRKKLKELGIPNSGSKPFLIRRHQEWINIFNSNCDAADNVRKTKRELLRELDEWERTQGPNTSTKDSHIMKKDFDGVGHASAHKSQFDDLIAKARAKARQRKEETNEVRDDGTMGQDPNVEERQPLQGTETQGPQLSLGQPPPTGPPQPFADNEAALSIIRHKVDEANKIDSAFPPLSEEVANANALAASKQATLEPTGFQDPFRSPTRKVPMFAMPADPVVDVESSTTVQ